MFSIAHIGNTFLAALILRLAQEGRMDLDAPLSDYLGDLPVDANGATVRQALGMRSGIGNTPADLVAKVRADCGRIWMLPEVLALTPAPSAAPGTTVDNSGPTYKLLAAAAEQVTGAPLRTALQDIVLEPVGVDRILLQGPTQPAPSPWALPIAGHEGAIDLAAYGSNGMLPCGSWATFAPQQAVASDAPSLARWGWGLFSGSLLDRDSLTAMTTVQPADSPNDKDLTGLGLEQTPDFYFGGLSYGYSGSQPGYKSFLLIMPERQVVAVLFINDDQADQQAGTRELVRAVDE
jgi:D-alanyl-D-alanine carboxypeptidase